jgi:hypothetical protein
MRLLACALLGLAALAACDDAVMGPAPGPRTDGAPTPAQVAGAAIPPRPGYTTFLCANGQVVRQQDRNDDGPLRLPGDRSRIVEVDGQSIPMIEASSASGVRYIGGGLQWWTRGLQTATLAPLGPNESFASAPGTPCRSAG